MGREGGREGGAEPRRERGCRRLPPHPHRSATREEQGAAGLQDAAPAGKGREVDPPPEPRGGQPPRPAVDLRPTPKRQVILRVVTPVSPW